MFWKVFKKYPVMITCQDKISYPELQDMIAIITMEEDYEKALNGLQIVEHRKMLEKQKRR